MMAATSMRGINRWVRPACLFGATVITACMQTQTQRVAAHPRLRPLTPLVRIVGTASNSVVDVAGLDTCRVLIADQRGRLIRLDRDGQMTILATVPGNRSIRLVSGSGNGPVAWASSPGWLARISLDPVRVDSISIPQHDWGGVSVGPPVDLGLRIAVAPLANPERFSRSRRGAAPARLIEVFDSLGGRVGQEGPSLAATGDYTTWRAWRGQLGILGDTLLFASLADGFIRRYPLNGPDSLPSIALPQYFRSVKPRAELLTFPWIQFGHFAYFMDTPQVAFAAFRSDGFLYAIRPYAYRWTSHPNRYIRRAGAWDLTEQGLEIYSTRGKSLGAFAVPAVVRGLQVDRFARLFILTGTDVLVVHDPLESNRACAFPGDSVMLIN